MMNDSSRPEPRSHSPSVPTADTNRSDVASDGRLDCTTCSVVGLVAGLLLAAVAILLWTAVFLVFDAPVAAASLGYDKATMVLAALSGLAE
jgi:hypothetical protein